MLIYLRGKTIGEPVRITDLDALKVFTHPLRIRLYRTLHTAEIATASQLANLINEATNVVSYHLRNMARHGIIEEATGHSRDGRERWWRPTSERGFSFRIADFADDPEGAAAVDAVARQLLATRTAQYEQFLNHQSAWPRRWTAAAFSSEYLYELTPVELREMSQEVDQLMRRWEDRSRSARAADGSEERERVAIQVYGFPFRY